MSAPLQFPQIPLINVFKRLAAEQGAGTTVVTPNRRLASALINKFDNYQVGQKVAVWESADIIPFSVFIERLYQDTLYSVTEFELPILLTKFQAQVLWESVIDESEQGKSLLAVSQTARLAQEAWQLSHAWQLFSKLNRYPLNEDGGAFLEWVQSYQHISKKNNQIDDVRLCDLMATLYEQLPIKKPNCLICYGFEIFTPQQISFLEVLAASNCEVKFAQPDSRNKSKNYSLRRTSYINAQSEIYHAAIWSRARIEKTPNVKIGVVVPVLSNYRNAIIRIFSAVMEPDVELALPNSAKKVMPFNVSLGMPLTSYPLINTLFHILALLGREIEYERVSLLLRSPFIGGGETEMSDRALLDAQLRKITEPIITISRLITLIKHANGDVSCPILAHDLSKLADFRRASLLRIQKPSAIAKIISEILNVVGFPGERVLNSVEYQALKKWHEVLATFGTLDSIITTLHYSEAISRLYRLASETLFQHETPDVPIQILGVMEAAGMEFDHLWVMGLSDEVWPMHPRPNAFLPIELQRQEKLPLGSSVESFNYSKQLTTGWLSCATEVIFSHPTCSDDRDGHELKPSALIKHITFQMPELPMFHNHLERILLAGKLEKILDDEAPNLKKTLEKENGISGGVAVIKDFSACPFKAMAKHRLRIENLTAPHVGLDASERGMLIHDVLAQCWRQLETKAALDDASDRQVEAIITGAVEQAINHLSKYRPSIHFARFKAIEQKRLERLAREWLDYEKKRSSFTVMAIEEKYNIHIGGLQLSTRLDRVDQLVDGSIIIIDYKTQKQSVASLLGDRLDEPQLPLYLVTAKPDAVAVVFAQVKIGAIGFVGVVRNEALLPGVKAYTELSRYDLPDSWEALVESWQQDLTNLAVGFSKGDARVDPKSSMACRYCDLQSFCRIHEHDSCGVMSTQGDDE